MKKAFLVTLSAIAAGSGALVSASCASSESPKNDPVGVSHNPPMPQTENTNPPAEPNGPKDPSRTLGNGLPTWEDVKSSHPPGATNPPSPYLVVTPEGACFKSYEGGMTRGGPDRVMNCGAACPGVRIQCPPTAATLLAAASPPATVVNKAPNPPTPAPTPTLGPTQNPPNPRPLGE